MDDQTSVIILGENLSICDRLWSDLDALGFNPLGGKYPDVDTDDIVRKPSCIIMLELTAIDHDALAVCELLSREDILPKKTALVALVSENTMGQIPIDYRFADVIKYPYDITELGFRLRRVIYLHHRESAGDIIRIGNLSISPSRCEVKVDGQPIILTHKEYKLLKYLITHHDYVSTREVLLTSIWGDNVIDGSRTVDVHIRRLRTKIGDSASAHIKTIRGVGYMLNSEGQ